MKTEIDLHGYTAIEAIEIFVNCYNRNFSSGNKSSISVIHGYGSSGVGGVIKSSFNKFLLSNSEYLSFQPDAWNTGKTVVFPQKKLPSDANLLSSEIIAFCCNGKTESKIIGKFRRYGDLKVKKVLGRLVTNRQLSITRKGKYKYYSKK